METNDYQNKKQEVFKQQIDALLSLFHSVIAEAVLEFRQAKHGEVSRFGLKVIIQEDKSSTNGVLFRVGSEDVMSSSFVIKISDATTDRMLSCCIYESAESFMRRRLCKLCGENK